MIARIGRSLVPVAACLTSGLLVVGCSDTRGPESGASSAVGTETAGTGVRHGVVPAAGQAFTASAPAPPAPLLPSAPVGFHGALPQSTQIPSAVPPASAPGAAAPVPTLLQRMEGALAGRPFRGTRRVIEFQASSVSAPEKVETLEDVGWDGAGRYAIELVEAVELPVGVDLLRFDMTFARSVHTRWKIHDFRVRSVGLALQNYSITDTGQTPTVAGIHCRTIEFRRLGAMDQRPGHYLADVDPATGVILAWRELDAGGALLAGATYESFAYGANFDDMVLRPAPFPSRPLDLHLPLDPQAGFSVRMPDVLPAGFELSGVRQVSIPVGVQSDNESFLLGGEWIRFTATDGIETLSFAHSAQSTASAPAGPGASAPGPPAVGSGSRIDVVTAGTWEVGLGRYAGVSFVVMGRVSLNDLRQLVESAF